MYNKQNPTRIHETIVKDIVDFMKDVKSSELVNFAKKAKENDFKSLTSKTSGLVLVFPVYTVSSANVDTASMIGKAQERQAVSMLQLLFSALNISTDENSFEFLKQFHGNIDSGSISVDKFMDMMDELPIKETANLDQVNKIKNDLRNLNFYFESDFSDHSINDYKILGESYRSYNGTPTIVLEDPIPPERTADLHGTLYQPNLDDYMPKDDSDDDTKKYKDVDYLAYYRDRLDFDRLNSQLLQNDREYEHRINQAEDELNLKRDIHTDDLIEKRRSRKSQDIYHRDDMRMRDRDYKERVKTNDELKADRDREFNQRTKMDDETIRNNRFKNKIDDKKLDLDTKDLKRREQRDKFNDHRDRITHQLVDNDVKKANELIPTLMIINFTKVVFPKDKNGNIIPNALPSVVPSQLLIGVKAKIYVINATEMIDRIIMKNKDNNGLLKLVKATTREISFLSDFLFAIDKAKLDVLAKTKKGSDAKIFKVLERRANNHKFKRRIGVNNADVAPISTFHITKDEVDLMKKYANLDVTNASVIRKIMESYNLMCFVITDDSAESASFIYDTGNDTYETISYRGLERENADNSAKKMINLMTKVAR